MHQANIGTATVLSCKRPAAVARLLLRNPPTQCETATVRDN